MGLVSTDEPRYADIGRAMASTGDLITPRLSGTPWFEKPPLLYWMIAAGFRAGLGPEVAPRLPVALLSVAFLVFCFLRVRRLWDTRSALCTTAILATSAGWVGLSGIAVTDIPLAVFFSAAVLLALDDTPRTTLATASLGLAVLAKSLVGPVLFAAVLAADYRRIRQWLRPAPVLAFLAIALPWHILCYLRNGAEFPAILFVQQQFGRFATAERQHEQPWWFYFPCLLLMLYPWFPLLPVAARQVRDRRLRIPLAVVLFGFAFFSASRNKLPGYLLPLLPSLCVLLGVGLARLRRPQWWIVLPIALLGILPEAARVLPLALAAGLRSAGVSLPHLALGFLLAGVAGAGLAFALKEKAVPAAVALTAGAFLWLKMEADPALDRAASARPLWLATRPVCMPAANRSLEYGLNYYAGKALPPCRPGTPRLDRSVMGVVR